MRRFPAGVTVSGTRGAMGAASAQVPYQWQVQLGDRARDDLVDPGPLRWDVDDGETRDGERSGLQAPQDGVGQGRSQLSGAGAAAKAKGRSEGGRVSMATDARIGTELAGYRIEAPIGRGGMGVVYRAEQLRLGRKVALKLLAPELAENAGFRARFEHESRLAAVARPPEHRAALRGRRGRRAAVHQHALRRGHGPARRCSRARAASSPTARSRSPRRSRARSTPPTPAASCTATSSRPTSSSPSDGRRRPGALLPDRLRPDEGHLLARRAHRHRAPSSAPSTTSPPSRSRAPRPTAAATSTRSAASSTSASPASRRSRATRDRRDVGAPAGRAAAPSPRARPTCRPRSTP